MASKRLYPRSTIKKIVKAHSNRSLSKNADVLRQDSPWIDFENRDFNEFEKRSIRQVSYIAERVDESVVLGALSSRIKVILLAYGQDSLTTNPAGMTRLTINDQAWE
ncbi:hypothetical protein HO133_003706 [Letharia lupina]|uniref:Uncharacterized protein n=1 Tax=Letharia lupina TaxID=560253 RepID=A0A8H6CB11_9LECA|nr:uncharacterized protein HO133_003706 [Letharia lupina]KAF6219881.1 hypothetical protein HO133_003706 [Letharia lupina]